MKNFQFSISTDNDTIIIEQKSSNTTERIFIDVSQHAAFVKGIGIAADEIYHKDRDEQ